ncbi:substrate-binding domain-containing protein [Frondihabitans australicus]|uniref:Molybdate/tungstate transport system substrate-binding protein n=1 Tax=Frondihabitans australicus TaxID=386892 RepID=A0A495IBN0_9MICO|nr:substrate-binding domain-containing protein [Frondihabitans australicus]RKR73329.1 molybdate/tungstate transport system substrate-binding protein [Frondihabitans australicus]
MNRTLRGVTAAALTLGLVTGVVACSGSSSTPAPSNSNSTSSSPSTQITGSGTVKVLYAGSLVDLMEKQVGPTFQAKTGFSYQGTGAGSSALATQIKGKTTKADVFISASPDVNATLEGAANGDWVSWYATFASSRLVIGYDPKSSFASQLKSKPWYEVIGQTGFRFGSTDAQLDPKGKLGNKALDDAATKHDQPALAALAKDFTATQPEESLVGRLQAGQLDAAFFYASEAKAAGIPTVPLTGEDLKAVYTITELSHAPDAKGGQAFIQYLLGPSGTATLKKNGFDVSTPATVTGSGVPKTLSSVLGK